MGLKLEITDAHITTPMHRHPTLDECSAAGRNPAKVYVPGHGHTEGGLPDTPEERERFEAYMRGHCWDVGNYDSKKYCYDTMSVRMLYGVWRDRGALPTTWANSCLEQNLPTQKTDELKRLRDALIATLDAMLLYIQPPNSIYKEENVVAARAALKEIRSEY